MILSELTTKELENLQTEIEDELQKRKYKEVWENFFQAFKELQKFGNVCYYDEDEESDIILNNTDNFWLD